MAPGRQTAVMATPRQLADRLHALCMAADPLRATLSGIPGYDNQVPDASEGGDAAWRSSLEAMVAAARQLNRTELSADDAVTLQCVTEHSSLLLAGLDCAADEYTVTATGLGPSRLLMVAARTPLSSPKAAQDYLERLRQGGRLIDQHSERLRIGASKGRLPVAPLVDKAIAWVEGVLADPIPSALSNPKPPAGWEGENAWREELAEIAAEVVKPALGRWADVLRDLLPRARPAERSGLVYVPGGDADYVRAIYTHTTVALSAAELHQIGLETIEALEGRALELGASLGLSDLAAVHDALRASQNQRPPTAAMELARRAIRRAEGRAADVVPEPLPPPCVVAPMPSVVAATGQGPNYSPAPLDGSRPGTFWFNTEMPTVTGWDLEGATFHETVPGHHLQFSRMRMSDLPDLQRFHQFTAFGEGWGLYAEQLAEELGLYSDTESLLGALGLALLKAARLVVDTGLHAHGWSRDQAVQFFVAHVPMAPEFLVFEVDRYIAWPGYALAFLTGKNEILWLRDDARRRLGPGFSLPEFHAAVLDHGSLPMLVLRDTIERWITTR